ncbi:MAG: carboxypeptidase-like regulatory domain-containing protein, partial [Bacteroidota bacterium]
MKLPFLYVNLFFLIACSFHNAAHAQARFTVSGYLKDSSNGESLIGATVYVREAKTGAQANDYGYYAITLAQGNYTFIYSYPGLMTKEVKVTVDGNKKLNMVMSPLGMTAKEVVISSERTNRNVTSTEMSRLEISGEKV